MKSAAVPNSNIERQLSAKSNDRNGVFASRSRDHKQDMPPAACPSSVLGNGASIMSWSNHPLLPCPSAPIPKN